MSSILSISISPNRDIVNEEILKMYLIPTLAYLNKNSSKYTLSLEKGSRDFHNHIQCVCETSINKESFRQYLTRKFKNLPGFHNGKKGINDGSTVCIVDRTKNGEVMFYYPLKENPTVTHMKGVTTEDLERLKVCFQNLPDLKAKAKASNAGKARRDSFKMSVEGATLVWKRIPKINVRTDVYLDKPIINYINIKKEYIKTRPDGSKYILKQKEMERQEEFHQDVDIPSEHGRIPDSNFFTPKRLKDIFLELTWERQSTDLWKQYRNNIDVIIHILKKWHKNREEEIYKNYVEDLVELEEEETESSLGVELSASDIEEDDNGVTN